MIAAGCALLRLPALQIGVRNLEPTGVGGGEDGAARLRCAHDLGEQLAYLLRLAALQAQQAEPRGAVPLRRPACWRQLVVTNQKTDELGSRWGGKVILC